MRSGRLLRSIAGVYAVGHARLRREGHWLAAVLAVGPGAVLSHRDAAGLHGLRPANHARDRRDDARGRASSATEDRVHRTRSLDADGHHHGPRHPRHTVARTLVDLAGDRAAGPPRQGDQGGRAAAHASTSERSRPRWRAREAARGPGHRALREAIEEHAALGPPPPTPSSRMPFCD